MDLQKRLRIYRDSHLNFPWNLFDGVPKIGATHNYLLNMMVDSISHELTYFIKGMPTIYDLNRYIALTEGPDGTVSRIVGYCQPLYDKEDWERSSREIEVFNFIKDEHSFLKILEKKVREKEGLTSLY